MSAGKDLDQISTRISSACRWQVWPNAFVHKVAQLLQNCPKVAKQAGSWCFGQLQKVASPLGRKILAQSNAPLTLKNNAIVAKSHKILTQSNAPLTLKNNAIVAKSHKIFGSKVAQKKQKLSLSTHAAASPAAGSILELRRRETKFVLRAFERTFRAACCSWSTSEEGGDPLTTYVCVAQFK